MNSKNPFAKAPLAEEGADEGTPIVLEPEALEGTEAPEAPEAAGDVFTPDSPDTEAKREWVRENWNDGNPHRKPALGQIVLSPVLANELRAIDWEPREADGIDPGVHRKATGFVSDALQDLDI